MNYNSGYKYNSKFNLYNSVIYKYIVNVYEVLRLNDAITRRTAFIALFESQKIADYLSTAITWSFDETIEMYDKSDNFVLFDIAEKLNIKDDFSDLVVMLYLMDKVNILDELAYLNAFINQTDSINVKDISNIEAFIEQLDKFGFNESKDLFALISEFESLNISDKNPRKAISDFYIGHQEGFDNAFTWLFPFDMMIDEKNSTIQVMPQTESNYIEMQGVDGSIVENTIYKNRLFNIIAYTKDGLTKFEKEEIKKEITRILDATKHETKKLTVQSADVSFDVKYSGLADIAEGPSFVKATIPLETSPYGYPLFDREVYGSGLILNDGQSNVGCVNYISAGCVNPEFQLGTITYRWNGTVPDNMTLIIDHEAYMCYLESAHGYRKNAITNLTGNFQRIPKESSIVLLANANTENYIRTTLKERILW